MSNVIFKSKEDAEKILSAINRISRIFGYVSRGDLYELSGLPTTYEDYLFGWFQIASAEVKNLSDDPGDVPQWVITLGEPHGL